MTRSDLLLAEMESDAWRDVVELEELKLPYAGKRMNFKFDPTKHGRDRVGRFRKMLDQLEGKPHGSRVSLPHGVFVRQGVRGLEVWSEGEKHRRFKTPHAAAAEALYRHDHAEVAAGKEPWVHTGRLASELESTAADVSHAGDKAHLQARREELKKTGRANAFIEQEKKRIADELRGVKIKYAGWKGKIKTFTAFAHHLSEDEQLPAWARFGAQVGVMLAIIPIIPGDEIILPAIVGALMVRPRTRKRVKELWHDSHYGDPPELDLPTAEKIERKLKASYERAKANALASGEPIPMLTGLAGHPLTAADIEEAKSWRDLLHPRVPKGRRGGGRFIDVLGKLTGDAQPKSRVVRMNAKGDWEPAPQTRSAKPVPVDFFGPVGGGPPRRRVGGRMTPPIVTRKRRVYDVPVKGADPSQGRFDAAQGRYVYGKESGPGEWSGSLWGLAPGKSLDVTEDVKRRVDPKVAKDIKRVSVQAAGDEPAGADWSWSYWITWKDGEKDGDSWEQEHDSGRLLDDVESHWYDRKRAKVAARLKDADVQPGDVVHYVSDVNPDDPTGWHGEFKGTGTVLEVKQNFGWRSFVVRNDASGNREAVSTIHGHAPRSASRQAAALKKEVKLQIAHQKKLRKEGHEEVAQKNEFEVVRPLLLRLEQLGVGGGMADVNLGRKTPWVTSQMRDELKAGGRKMPWVPTRAGRATPAVATKPTMTLEQIQAKLKPGEKKVMGDLPDGTVIETPDGIVGILKPSEGKPTYGDKTYVVAYNIKTGQQFEPPAVFPPVKSSSAPTVKKAAQAMLDQAGSSQPQEGSPGPQGLSDLLNQLTNIAGGGGQAAPVAPAAPTFTPKTTKLTTLKAVPAPKVDAKLKPAAEVAAAAGVDITDAFAQGQDASPQNPDLAERRMRAAAAIFESDTAVPNAVLGLIGPNELRQKKIDELATGVVERAEKEYAFTPLVDLEVLGGVHVKDVPVQGQAVCNLVTRQLTMGSSSNIGDFRHELGHAIRSAWSGGSGPGGVTPLTTHVFAQYDWAKQKAAGATGGPDVGGESGWKANALKQAWWEQHGAIDPRCLDSPEENAAEQYRAYHKALYQMTQTDAPDHDPGALEHYRQTFPEWARMWDAWYTAAMGGQA